MNTELSHNGFHPPAIKTIPTIDFLHSMIEFHVRFLFLRLRITWIGVKSQKKIID